MAPALGSSAREHADEQPLLSWPVVLHNGIGEALTTVHNLEQRLYVQANTQTENWCGVVQEVVLPGLGSDPAAFLDAAVTFCNDKWVSTSRFRARRLEMSFASPLSARALTSSLVFLHSLFGSSDFLVIVSAGN